MGLALQCKSLIRSAKLVEQRISFASKRCLSCGGGLALLLKFFSDAQERLLQLVGAGPFESEGGNHILFYHAPARRWRIGRPLTFCLDEIRELRWSSTFRRLDCESAIGPEQTLAPMELQRDLFFQALDRR